MKEILFNKTTLKYHMDKELIFQTNNNLNTLENLWMVNSKAKGNSHIMIIKLNQMIGIMEN